MTLKTLDLGQLNAFELAFDPLRPEGSRIPASVLGYGEISTVLEIRAPGWEAVACKRMPMFRDRAEVEAYLKVYSRYLETLEGPVGLRLVPGRVVTVQPRRDRGPVLYILQERVPAGSIGHQAIRSLSEGEVVRLVQAVMTELGKVSDFNRTHRSELEIGFDAQISNWAILGSHPGGGPLPASLELAYLDTSTPLLRLGGQEQLDPELFLRSAPSFLVWILRWLFLEDVMTRYYDLRRVALDLVANFYKEGRPELIPALLQAVNLRLAQTPSQGEIRPITVREVRRYYWEDAWIWRLYLGFRRLDRRLHRALRREYPYVLPGRIRR